MLQFQEMKILLIGILILWKFCSVSKVPGVQDMQNKTPETTADTIDFAKQVQPIMVSNCSPCHFPGGKMYSRLPFDKDTTIINHSPGILKRIKNKEQNSLLQNFILQNKNGLRKEGHEK